MAEFAASLAPGDDFSAIEKLDSFLEQLVIAGRIFVNNFAVVENGFDFLRSRLGAEGKRSKRRASGTAGRFLARSVRARLWSFSVET